MLYKAKEEVTQSYDTIVIGSGLGGMTAANKLAKDGRRVLLLESHNKLGGLATWFHRRTKGGHIFDVSLHAVPALMKKTFRKYWNQDIADRMVPIKQVRFINPQFELATDFSKRDFVNILREKFAVSQENIEGFFHHVQGLAHSLHLGQGQGQGQDHGQGMEANRDLFERYFPKRPDIVRFLLAPISYANGSTLEDPAVTYGIVFSNFIRKGLFIFKGGTDLLISLLKKQMLAHEVDIKLHTFVEKILLKRGRVVGVLPKGGRPIWSRSVISNGNLKGTIFNLVGGGHFPAAFLKKAREVRLAQSSCQVYMGIKQGEHLPYRGDLIFHSEEKEFSTEGLLSPRILAQTFSLYGPETRPHWEDQRYTIVSSSNARYEDWEGLEKGTVEYLAHKEFLQQRALDTIEKIIPGVRDKIDCVDSATPKTIRHYTHHLCGASFGTKFEGLEVSKKLPQYVPGLFHCGSVGIIMSGWPGTSNYGVIQAHEVNDYLD